MKLYTIFLPMNYNDGHTVEIEKFEEVEKDLVALFGGITMSSEMAPMKCVWLYKGVQFKDRIVKIEIVTEETKSIDRFFHNYKEKLKEMFQQVDILITVTEIRTL